jgi:hypothetical protein
VAEFGRWGAMGDSRTLRAGARRMLDAAMDAYPNPISKSALDAMLQVATSGGTFSEILMNPGTGPTP